MLHNFLRCIIEYCQMSQFSDSKGQRFESPRPQQRQHPFGRCLFLFCMRFYGVLRGGIRTARARRLTSRRAKKPLRGFFRARLGVSPRPQQAAPISASDIRKQRFCKNCEAPQNRCKAADARQRGATLPPKNDGRHLRRAQTGLAGRKPHRGLRGCATPALLGGMQDPITQQMPLRRQSFAALFSYGTAQLWALPFLFCMRFYGAPRGGIRTAAKATAACGGAVRQADAPPSRSPFRR